MAKPEWGEKHRCSACGKPFYDMKKSPIICPACGAENVPERLLKPRRPSGAAAEPPKKVNKKAVDPDLIEEDEDLDEDLDDDLVDPDTVDLPDDDEDDDDLSGVVIAPKGDDES